METKEENALRSTHYALYSYVDAFIDELARSGVCHVVVCPGSRSTPLALVLADETRLRTWMHVDERSAAFFALGMAKALREPVALVCTSGTAAANFFPAVVEAHYSHVPLLVLTADRPPELRDSGAPQTIDQIKLYSAHAKWFFDMLLPEATPDALRFARTMAGRAVATASATPAGPVHLNFPFREPLVPVRGDDIADFARNDNQPYVQVKEAPQQPSANIVSALAQELEAAQRGLIICGPQNEDDLGPDVAQLAKALGWPVLADPLSGVRSGPHDRSLVVDAYDAFLRDNDFVNEHAPDIVLRFGAMPTSKQVLLFLQKHSSAQQIMVDGAAGWNDPTLLVSQVIHADAALLCRALSQELENNANADSSWLNAWLNANQRTKQAMDAKMAGMDEMFEGKVFAELCKLLPDGATLFSGNSMPVRDLDTFFGGSDKAIRVLCNRGANGIDGVVSSALGAGAVTDGPLVLVIGDLSFYHDMNGLLAAKLHQLDATIVLINNDGGGIFSFLPQASQAEHFEQLFGTPIGLDYSHAAAMYGANFERPACWQEFRAAVSNSVSGKGLSIIEVRTNRQQNVTQHRDIWKVVSAALDGR